MSAHTLEDVVIRQKQHQFRDLLAVFVLALGLALMVFSVVAHMPTHPAERPADQASPTLYEGQSPASATARTIDDTPHFL